MKPTEEDEPRGGRTTTKSAPMKLEKPSGPAVLYGRGQVSSETMPPVPVRRDSLTRSCLKYPMSRWVLKNRAQPRSSGQRRLEAQNDIYDETPGTPTIPAETPGENATDEDIVAAEVAEELNRVKTLGRFNRARSVDQLMLLRFVYSQKTNEPLDERVAAEGRERELATLCSQDALFVIVRTALRSGAKMIRGKFVDDMKNGRVKRFVAVEVARDVRYDVHAGTPALKALGVVVSLAATREGRHRPRTTWWRRSCTRAYMRSWELFPKGACWREERASCC